MKQTEYTVYLSLNAAMTAITNERLLGTTKSYIERVTVHNPDKTHDKGFRVRIEPSSGHIYYL